jgi:iron complex outermembrane receptor protein
VFYYDYDNFQAFFFADTTSRLINSKAEFYGGEVELTVSPGNGWDFLAGISLLDTTVNGASPGGIEIKDQEAPLAPAVSVNGLIRKSWDIASGASIAAQLSGNYADKQFFNVVNADVTEGGDYTLLDAKLSYFSPDDVWEVSIFVNNLTDEEALTYSYDITGFGNYTIQVFGPPRWAGAKFKYNF